MATYCVCKKKDEEGVLWISCDKCKGWYHPTCVGLRNDDIDEDNDWFCPLCKNESGSLSQNFGQEWRRCGRTKCKNFVEGDELLCIDCKLVLVERNSNKIKRMRLEETRNNDDVEVESATSPIMKKEANPLKKKALSSSSVSRDQKPKFKVQASFKAPKATSSTTAASKPERTQSPTPTAPIRKDPVASPRPISIDHLLFNSPPTKLDSVAKRLDSIKDQMKKPIVKSPSLSDNPDRSPMLQSPSIENGKSPMMSYKKRELEASTTPNSTPTSMSMPLKKRFKHDFESPASSPIATPTPSKLESCLSTHVHMSVNSLGTTSSQNEAVSVK